MLPEPVWLASSIDVAQHLELDRKSADRVMDARVAGPLYVAGNRRMIAWADLEQLIQWPFVSGPHPAAFVARVSAARPDDLDPDRAYLGWRGDLPPAQRLDGVARWWPAIDPDALVGTLFIAVLATFVVETAMITGWRPGTRGLRHFDLVTPADDSGADRFTGHRIRTPPGGNTLYLPEQ